MSWRVNLTDQAMEDLQGLDRSVVARVFKKLRELEGSGPQLGKPLGSRSGTRLAGLRKLTVGNRDWRIIFAEQAEGDVLDVLVVGKRTDEWCYQEAARRIAEMGDGHPSAQPLRAALEVLAELRGVTAASPSHPPPGTSGASPAQ